MSPERNLGRLLAALEPELHPGAWVFCQLAGGEDPVPLQPTLVFREREGVTVLLPEQEAVRLGLAATYPCRWITLRADSDLDAVGLLAAVTGRIAAAGISCNVVSAFSHDHLLVPLAAVDKVMALLLDLQSSGEGRPRGSGRGARYPRR